MDTKMPKTATYQEIITQTEAWNGALQAVSDGKEAIKEIVSLFISWNSARGLNPDQPHNLTAVVKLDLE